LMRLYMDAFPSCRIDAASRLTLVHLSDTHIGSKNSIERIIRVKDLSLKELRTFSKVIDEDVRSAISLTNSVRLRKTRGGTGAEAVRARLSSLRKK
ncbi:MAG TPA: hypothetical protein VF325_01520, partial [Candidatus Deferrimicrobium sp.]